MPFSRAKALLFDMDGLMVDSEPVWDLVQRDLAQSLGCAWTDEMSAACVGTGLASTIRLLRERFGVALSVADGVERLEQGFLARLSQVRLQPGCAELVAAASGRFALAVASSSTRVLVHALVSHTALGAHFAAVVSGQDVARTKPAPDVFLEAARRLGHAPSDCVVLEDSMAGVMAARGSGAPVIAVPARDPSPFRKLTPFVLGSLHEALSLLGLSQPHRK